MASSFQRQAQIRKVGYGALILLLFTATLFWRQFMERQADRLALREANLGEVELTGSVVRLLLTGSRGGATCILWLYAMDQQRKQEWNDLELTTMAITKLQPHFATPWKFLSWNLAYNVSVECDKPRDKYFYICRGIELLAEGERQNRNNPDLRFDVGFFYHNKLGMADENNTLRSLFQLSCIDPAERDPERMRKLDGAVDLEKFEQFCHRHPILVRRLRETLACNTPDDVLAFLDENYEVPSRYEYPARRAARGSPFVASRLKPPEKQFPVLPTRAEAAGIPGIDYTADDPTLPDDFDNFAAAGVWFAYAQGPMPPIDPADPFNDDYDRTRYRLPRSRSAIIPRQYPALSRNFVAQRLQKEGWFDGGWEVDAGRSGIQRWFPERVVLGDRKWSSESWGKARSAWEEHCARSGLIVDPQVREAKKRQSEKYRAAYGVPETQRGPDLRPEHADDAEMKASMQAHRQIYWTDSTRNITNFGHHLAVARAESQADTIDVRRLAFKAEQMRKAAEPAGDIVPLYEQAFPKLKAVLEKNEEFRKDLDVQEETYKLQYEYLKLLQEEERGRLGYVKPLLVIGDTLGQAIRPAGAAQWLPTCNLLPPRTFASGIVGPFDGTAPDGQPFLSIDAVRRARSRLGINDPPPPLPPGARPPMPDH